MSEERPRNLQITLHPDGVAAPAHRAVEMASNVIGTCLRALQKDDLSPPELQAGAITYQFGDLELEVSERRQAYQNWLLAKGFQDLTRGVRESLEEAIFYIEMTKMRSGQTTWSKVQAHMAGIRAEASKPPFPQLLGEVNAGLKERMAFEAEFLSLQRVRNCLEHRGGIVGQRDVDPATNTLSLRFARLRMFYFRGTEEVEIALGEPIDPGPENADPEGVQIYMHRVIELREYALGEPVVITPSDFNEIAMACQLFASDLASKLPMLTPTGKEIDPGSSPG